MVYTITQINLFPDLVALLGFAVLSPTLYVLDLNTFISSIKAMVNVIPVPAFKDNYIWLLINPDNQSCAIVDPGDAEPVLDYIKQQQLSPCAILITHHHFDHSGGIPKLHALYPDIPIFGPTVDEVLGVDHKLVEGNKISLMPLNLEMTVLDIPGHTHGHIAYYGDGMLFCGDTLFAAGCGRLFEGTAPQMFKSLAKLAALPPETKVYCAHEYTAANLRFATVVEPENADVQKRSVEVDTLRAQNQVTLPSTIATEKLTNPFLRCDQESVINSVQSEVGKPFADSVSIFQALRAWKDRF